MEPEQISIFWVFTMTVSEWGYWVQVVSAAVFTYLILSSRGEDREKPWRIAYKLAFLVAVFVAIFFGFSVLMAVYRPFAGVGAWVSYIVGVMLYALLFSRHERYARNVTAAICFSTIILVNEMGSVFGILLERAIPGITDSATKTSALLLLIPAMAFLRRHPLWKYYVSEPASFLGVFANTLSTMTVIVYDIVRINLFGPDETSESMMLMVVVMMTLYLINTVSYQMIFHLSREQTHVLDLQATTQMDKSAASLMAVTENNLNELHKINHDIQNQYAYMRMLLKSGSYEALGKYFDELTGTFSEPLVPFVECGNRVLDLIFNMENAKAQEAGITLDVKAATPHTLPFRELDLCNLYANLIDNAMEACIAEKTPDPIVHVTVNVRGDYLFTQVSNPTTKDKSFLEKGAHTTKENRRLHGKGMEIVRGIVKRYNGRYAARIDDGVYYAEFLLDLTYREEQHE